MTDTDPPQPAATTVKAKWLAALRSGHYQQAFGHLKTTTGYCCLGVLCEVALAGKWQGHDFLSTEHGRLAGSVGDGAWGELIGPGGDAYARSTAVTMNDGGHAFPEIADYLEGALP